ncbi:MAG: sugar ABC transporter permease [Thermotogae bacterium]|nr:sugar ABC transporter permease [Thermotogota bacterium]
MKKSKIRETLTAYVCLSPALLLSFIFVVIPMIAVFYLSFTNWNLVDPTPKFIGWKNYVYIFKDEKFIKSIRNTLYFASVKIPLDLVLSLFIAVLLDKGIRMKKFYRISYFAPVVTPMVATALIWLWLFDPTFGPLNEILRHIGLKPLKWLYDPKWAMPSIILFSLWKGLGYDVIIFLAGLQSIPRHLIEAAYIDGANSRQAFFKITLPLLSPIVYFVVLMGIINSFKIFTQISVMTPNGGPLYSTGVMVFYIYQQAFENYRMGRAASASVVLFGMVMALTQVHKKLGGSKSIDYS